MYLDDAFSWVSHSRFFGNRAIYSGGAIELENSTYSIKECIIDGNYAERGAGIISNYSATIFMESTLVVSNFSNTNGGGISMVEGSLYAFNSIFWNNYGANGTDEEAQASSYGEPLHNFAYNSCVQGSSGESWNNQYGTWSVLNTEPRFVDLLGPDNIPGTGDEDYHLIATSPCIDAGTNFPYENETESDYDLNTRFIDDPYTVDTGDIYNEFGTALSAVIDIGPYEFVANEAGVPGDKIWINTGASLPEYTDSDNWAPETPIEGDRAILVYQTSIPFDWQDVMTSANVAHSQVMVAEGAFLFELEGNTFILDSDNGAEVEVGAFFNNINHPVEGSKLQFYNGTLVAERIKVHGEDYGVLWFDDDLVVKTASIEVEPGAQLFLNNSIFKLTPASDDVDMYVQGLISFKHADYGIEGSLSLVSVVEDETQSQSGLVNIIVRDYGQWPTFTGSVDLDGTLQLPTSGISDAAPGDSYVLLEAEDGFLGAFTCVVSGGFDDDRFVYTTIQDTTGNGQQLVLHVESTSNLLGFGDPQNTALSGNPADAELADMDGDGDVDLVISLPGVNQVVVLFNGGNDPTTGDWLGFSDGSVAISVGTTPAGLALGDIEGDAAIDIAVACTNSDEVWILENQYSSSGNFVTTAYDVSDHIPPELGDVNAEPVDVAIGNFVDGGGDDIAVANRGDGTILILGSTGLRSNPFGGGEPINVGMATSVDPIDVNSDKDLDSLAVGGKGDGTVAVVKDRKSVV